MLNKLNKSEKGFTIIEVIIVLAIAGLIILIVLLAVPALQRNGRNTAIKNDASSLAGGVSDFKTTNDGATPTGVTKTGNEAVFTASGETDTTAKVQGDTEVTAATTVPAEPGIINVAFGRKCNTDGTGLDTAASRRSVAFFYRVETSAGGAGDPRCLDG